jgi:ethanolamine phosphate transferase 2 subunit G
MENSRQVVEVVRNTFPGTAFERDTTSIPCETLSEAEELGCLWREFLQEDGLENGTDTQFIYETSLLDFLKKSQRLMQNTASNYHVPSLYAGCLITSISATISLLVAHRQMRLHHSSALPLMVTLFAYGSVMFASSYVEEEQQFWYWITSAWITVLHIKS